MTKPHQLCSTLGLLLTSASCGMDVDSEKMYVIQTEALRDIETADFLRKHLYSLAARNCEQAFLTHTASLPNTLTLRNCHSAGLKLRPEETALTESECKKLAQKLRTCKQKAQSMLGGQ